MPDATELWLNAWTHNSHHPPAAELLSKAHEMLVEAEEDGTKELVPAALALVRQAYERNE